MVATQDEFLTISQVADLIGCSERHARKLIESGALPAWRPSPQIIRVPRSELMRRIYSEIGVQPEV